MNKFISFVVLSCIASVSFANGYRGDQTQAAASARTDAAAIAVVEGDSNQSTYQEAKNPVASAIAPPLAASYGDDSCLGSSSMGVQTMTFGFSGGTTHPSVHCILLRQAKFAADLAYRKMGDVRMVNALLCQDPRWRAAALAIGVTCPGVNQPTDTKVSVNTSSTEQDSDLLPAELYVDGN